MQTMSSYIQSQAIGSAIINMIVNPLLSWLGNRDMQATVFTSIAIDMTITCLIMSTAIAFFITSGVERGLSAGTIRNDDDTLRVGLLSHFPRTWWALGISLGFCFAILLVPLTLALFAVFGLSELPFWGLVVFKIVYTGAVAYAVTRWVILRQLEASR